MKRIEDSLRVEVIKLFFYGCTYDEIMGRVGIAKGSVVNIIQEFRDGTLSEPPELLDYIDELRRVAVDLKRHRIKLEDISSFIRISSKFLGMEVDIRDIKLLLRIYRGVDGSGISRDLFVGAALELARLIEENGTSYSDLLRDYMIKLRNLGKINSELEIKRAELKEAQDKMNELKSQPNMHKARYEYCNNKMHYRNHIWSNSRARYHRTRNCSGGTQILICGRSVS